MADDHGVVALYPTSSHYHTAIAIPPSLPTFSDAAGREATSSVDRIFHYNIFSGPNRSAKMDRQSDLSTMNMVTVIEQQNNAL